MKNKFLFSLFALFIINVMFIGCKKDLTVVPNSLLSESDVYTDKSLCQAVLARFYGQIGTGGPFNNNDDGFQQQPDDVINNRGPASGLQIQYAHDLFRTFDYGLIRRINQFLVGIRSAESKKSMSAFDNASFEGQAMFLRAYTFFLMVKGLGGMTIVNDTVFEFGAGGDVTPLQLKRNSEQECYDYILDQCDQAAAKLSTPVVGIYTTGTIAPSENANQALANKYACLMLKARAALTAASIAKFSPGVNGTTKVDKNGVQTHGILGGQTTADLYYAKAFDAANKVIQSNAYSIMTGPSTTDVVGAQQAFQKAINVKAGNTEVIWATDRKLGTSINTQYTRVVGPVTHTIEAPGNQLGAGAEFVDTFEDRTGVVNAVGIPGPRGIKTRTGGITPTNPSETGTPIIYDLNDTDPTHITGTNASPASNPFYRKDTRLWASVIWPQALFMGTPVDLRAGEWRGTLNADGTLYLPGAPGTPTPPAGTVLTSIEPKPKSTAGSYFTSINGPFESGSQIVNKTGFIPRKWLDEAPGATLGPAASGYSDMWWIRFRLAEAYSICAESVLFSSVAIPGANTAVSYINVLRRRGLLPDLTPAQFDFAQLRRELRIEFFLEDHRMPDMNRWRLAHIYWDGPVGATTLDYPDRTSYPWQIYPYTVNIGGTGSTPNPANPKYVFERKRAFRKRQNANFFLTDYYYNFMTKTNNGANGAAPDWLTWNPNWDKNPGE